MLVGLLGIAVFTAVGCKKKEEEKKVLKVAYASVGMSLPYHATAANYFEREAKKRGFEVMILDDQLSLTKSVENAQIAADAGYDVFTSITIGVGPFEEVVQMLEEAGVQYIGVDVLVPGEPFFGCDHEYAGYITGEALGQYAIDRWGPDPKIDLYISLESWGNPNANTPRMDNMLAGARTKVDIPDSICVRTDVPGNDAEVAMKKTEDTINAHPEAKRILIGCYVDDMAQGAEAVVEKKGMNDQVLIVSIDGSTLAVNNFKNPNTSWVAATTLFPEMYGYYLLNEIEKWYNSGKTQPLPEKWGVEHKVITKDNYKEVLMEEIGSVYPDYTVE
jgi:ABC-type sugar transport system substrate-binding protein